MTFGSFAYISEQYTTDATTVNFDAFEYVQVSFMLYKLHKYIQIYDRTCTPTGTLANIHSDPYERVPASCISTSRLMHTHTHRPLLFMLIN